MLTTAKAITFGQKSTTERQYYLAGILDEVRLYNATLQPNEILGLKDLWHKEMVTGVIDVEGDRLSIFPNPVTDGIFWIDYPHENISDLQLNDLYGKSHSIMAAERDGDRTRCTIDGNAIGLFFLRVSTQQRIQFYKILIN